MYNILTSIQYTILPVPLHGSLVNRMSVIIGRISQAHQGLKGLEPRHVILDILQEGPAIALGILLSGAAKYG
jgi:hypothetical protein